MVNIMIISTTLNELILINIIRIVLFINNIISKISFILKTDDDINSMRKNNDNYKLLLKYYNDDTDKIIKLENKLHTYYNLNVGLIKKIDEFKKEIEYRKDRYNNLEIEFNKNIDDYFNLNLKLEQSYYKNKHLKFLLKNTNSKNKTLITINKRLLL